MSDRRMNLAILFVDLSNSTGIAAGIEPEQYLSLLDSFRSVLGRVVSEHGGEIARIDGDGALCLFGYPTISEDCGRRAIEAALDLQEEFSSQMARDAASGGELQLHIGIHAGIVLLRQGDMVRGRFEVIGDVTNVAARLCDAAGPGEILASDFVLGNNAGAFITAKARSVSLAGHEQELAVYPVLGRDSGTDVVSAEKDARRTPFIGRQSQREAIEEWLAVSGGRPICLVHGDTGSGKTRFLEQIALEHEGGDYRIVFGRCEQGRRSGLLQALSRLSDTGGPVTMDATAEPDGLVDEIVDAISTRPALLLIDDWQNADEATRALVTQLCSVVGAAGMSARLRIVLAARVNETVFDGGIETLPIGLEPFTIEERREFVEATVGMCDASTFERLDAATGGLPLLLEEACRTFKLTGDDDRDDFRSLPYDLSIQARCDKLDPAPAALLEMAAVIGDTVPLALLAEIAGGPLSQQALDALADAGFLEPDRSRHTWKFSNGLARDAIYSVISRQARMECHRRILRALEARAADVSDEEYLGAMAFHALGAGDTKAGIDHAVSAGALAAAQGAFDRAQEHLGCALETMLSASNNLENAGRIRSTMTKLGLACVVDPSLDQLPLFKSAAEFFERAGDATGVMRSRYWMGAIAYGLGLGRASVLDLRAAHEIACDNSRQRDADQIEVKLAHSLLTSGRYDEALELFEAHIPKLIGPDPLGGKASAAYAVSCLGFMLADRGGFEAAYFHFDGADALLDGDDVAAQVSIAIHRVCAALWQSRWDTAIDLAQRGLRGANQWRTRYQTMFFETAIAFAQWKIERRPAHVERLAKLVGWFGSGRNSSQQLSLMIGWLTEAHAEAGHHDEAREACAKQALRVRDHGDRLGEAMSWRAVAHIECERGRLDRARRYLWRAEYSAAVRSSMRETLLNSDCRKAIAALADA